MPKRPTQEQRIVEEHFQTVPLYRSAASTYSAIPWVLRRAIPLLNSRELTTLVYLYLRAGKESVLWPDERKSVSDLGVAPATLRRALKGLATKGFIRIVEQPDRQIIGLIDPVHALRELASARHASGEFAMADSRFRMIADDFDLIGISPPLTRTRTVAQSHGTSPVRMLKPRATLALPTINAALSNDDDDD